jgi:DNA ligase-1
MKNKSYPTLYALSSKGKVKIWKIHVFEFSKEEATIIIKHGYVDGKEQCTSRVVKYGKNIGKSNETTPWEQACKEAESLWNKKHDKNYQLITPKLGDKPRLLLPMLAHNYTNRGKDIKWPARVQPKLNGIRCLAKITNDGVEYTSRKGKPFFMLHHLDDTLSELFKEGDILDGELYTNELTFQEIVQAVKRENLHSNTEKIQFWIYDIAIPDMQFKHRIMYLYNQFKKFMDTSPKPTAVGEYIKGPLVYVDTYTCHDPSSLNYWHQSFIKEGYEGTIIRNSDSMYCFDHRSEDLQKYKEFFDEEFKIVGGHEGTGKDRGTVIFECKTNDSKIFSVRPRGSFEQRTKWWENLDSLIDKPITVRYQNLSDDGIPIFPVGISVRDYE